MRVTIDLMKKSTQIIDLSDVINPRVCDDDLLLPLHIVYGDNQTDMRGKDVEFISEDTNKQRIYVGGTCNTDTPGDNLYMGNLTFRFPANTFKADGTYDPDKTMFRIVDKATNKVISSVNVKITVMKNSLEFDFDPDNTSYDSRLEEMLHDFHDKGQAMLDDIKNLNDQAKSNVSGDTAATAKEAKQQADTNAGDISDLKGEVAGARGRFADLPGREDAQDTAIGQKETIVNANANYAALKQKDAQQDTAIANKADKFELEDRLAQMDLQPEAFESEAALKAKYPNGKAGLMITADTGHKWVWINGAWKDCGIYQSAGDPERKDAHIGTAEQSSRVYDSLGDAIRDQAGQITRAAKQSFATSYIAYPFHKEDNIAYAKDVKSTTYSAGSYYFNIKGSALLRIQTTVEPYINYFTFLDANGEVLDYQRSDDKKSTVDFVVAPPSSAATLVLGTEPNSQTAHDSVTVYTNKLEIGKVYQGNISDSSFSLDANMLRASIVIDSDKYENLISVDSVYQVSDDHLDSWDSQVLIPQGSGIKSVLIRKADNSAFNATDVYSHFTLTQIPKVKLHLNSYQNGLTDISDRFRLSYNTINKDSDGHYVTFNSNIKNGKRISSQFVRVDKAESWLIDLDDGYQVSFITAKPDKDGNNFYHDFYDNKHILRTATDWKTGKVYENLYPEGSYAITLGHTGDSLVTINDIWDHVRIYVVDNNVHMPDYYRGYMDTKVRELNDALIDPNNFGFGFITDVHAEYNTKHFPALIDKIRTKTAIDEFVGGGDWATGYMETASDPEASKSELFTSFEELRQLFKGVPLLKTIGNHEWAYGANNAYNISTKELYGYYLRDEDKMFRDIHWGADHTYYYWDNQQAKCRYISLNVMDYPDTIKPTGNADNKEWYFKVGDTQIQWLKDTLNSVPDGYVVAIESHLVPLSADQFASFPAAKIGTTISNGEDLQAIASAYAAKTGDFANAKGNLLAWFGGHYHADDITVRSGVTYVTTIADCMSVWDIKGAPQKTAGTVSEQAFDVATVDRANRKVNLIRIGDGSDRSFTY